MSIRLLSEFIPSHPRQKKLTSFKIRVSSDYSRQVTSCRPFIVGPGQVPATWAFDRSRKCSSGILLYSLYTRLDITPFILDIGRERSQTGLYHTQGMYNLCIGFKDARG